MDVKLLNEKVWDEYNLYVENMEYNSVKDDYEKGQDTRIEDSWFQKINREFESFNNFLEYVENTYTHLEKINDLDYWSVIDNRLIYNQLENKEGYYPSKNEIVEWEDGEIELYSSSYDFSVKLVKSYKPSENELRKLTNIRF